MLHLGFCLRDLFKNLWHLNGSQAKSNYNNVAGKYRSTLSWGVTTDF